MSSIAGMEKVAMSRFEADEFINDRYAAMEQRLQVRSSTVASLGHPDHLDGEAQTGCCSGRSPSRALLQLLYNTESLTFVFAYVGVCRSFASVSTSP